MPNIVNPWDVVGELCSEAAEKCGLKTGTPIIAGAGDAITIDFSLLCRRLQT